jgi:hypothetical protein
MGGGGGGGGELYKTNIQRLPQGRNPARLVYGYLLNRHRKNLGQNHKGTATTPPISFTQKKNPTWQKKDRQTDRFVKSLE